MCIYVCVSCVICYILKLMSDTPNSLPAVHFLLASVLIPYEPLSEVIVVKIWRSWWVLIDSQVAEYWIGKDTESLPTSSISFLYYRPNSRWDQNPILLLFSCLSIPFFKRQNVAPFWLHLAGAQRLGDLTANRTGISSSSSNSCSLSWSGSLLHSCIVGELAAIEEH